MASKESEKMIAFYQEWTRLLQRGLPLPTVRKALNTWGDLTAEPHDVAFTDMVVAGVECILSAPSNAAASEAILVCLHGGGFMTGSAESHRKLYGHIAKATGCKALVLDYTLAPQNKHPGIITEIVNVYAELLQRGYSADRMATMGDSAGGGMSITSVLYAMQLGYPAPAACVPISPWFDMECKGASIVTNAAKDALVQKDLLLFMADNHLGTKSPRGPLANALYADLRGLPPILIQVGGHETLLDDSIRFYALALNAGLKAELEIFPEMQHVFHMLAGNAPEADDAIAKIAKWLRPKLGIGGQKSAAA